MGGMAGACASKAFHVPGDLGRLHDIATRVTLPGVLMGSASPGV